MKDYIERGSPEVREEKQQQQLLLQQNLKRESEEEGCEIGGNITSKICVAKEEMNVWTVGKGQVQS